MTLPRPTADRAERRAQAIGATTRRALLAEVEGSSTPIGVRELAERSGLHANAVRQHLAVLRDAGLVVESRVATGRVGRPASVYRAAHDADVLVDRCPFVGTAGPVVCCLHRAAAAGATTDLEPPERRSS